MNIRLTSRAPAFWCSSRAIFGRMSATLRTLPTRLSRLSLRTLLGAAALAALITAAALGTLLLVTAGSARSVVQTAQQTHDRVQAYSLLITGVRSFQNASYANAHLKTPQTQDELAASYARYREALNTALNLPHATAYQRDLAERIAQHAKVVEAQLADTLQVVTRIDRVWQTGGRRAAGLEAEQAARPYREFLAVLEAEIGRGDKEIAVATARALTLSRSMLIACIVCLGFAAASWAIIHLLLLWRIGPGLRRLEEGTLAFAAGNLGHRVRLGGNDELAQLSSSFDTMAEMLAEKQMALQQVQVGLERAVRQRTDELERANKELSASDGRRRAFLADIGHELRTPLTIIRGEAQVALRTRDEPDFNPREALERIIEHTHDLSRMVEDLFLIARAEAGGLPMQVRRIDLREVATRIANDFEALASDMGATISAVPGPAVYCEADPDRLRRALAALIDNALRHTRDGVNVVLETRATARGALIAVLDDGPGVDPILVPELFQRFRRGHTRGEGSGLGLSLARALVEAQSGRARLENRAEGGTRAILEFDHMRLPRRERNHESAAG
jgi:signal transduction histidine kinase